MCPPFFLLITNYTFHLKPKHYDKNKLVLLNSKITHSESFKKTVIAATAAVSIIASADSISMNFTGVLTMLKTFIILISHQEHV